jgi:iron(III) transport system ATP-binding protein/putative spermidine/putrescine transport system ATP-binding protein
VTEVSVERLIKRYGTVTAVNGVDLVIKTGEFLVLLGPSGCGKTTTLRCIAGLEDVSDGRILIDGKVVSQRDFAVPPEQRSIGMVFQSYAVWPHMTVFDNVAFGLKLKKISRAAIAERVKSVLALVGLEAFSERGIHQLSGGQQQRVALARAVVLEPGVLLFDEPLSNLDAQLREHMRFELRQLQQRLGITSIYVTHDQQEAMVVADRIVLMERGRIAQIGTPAEIYNRPRSVFAASFVGLTNTASAKVIESDGRGTRVRTSDGTVLVSSDTGFGAGTDVQVLTRPEHVVLSETAADGANVLSGTVETALFLGNLSDVTVRVGAALLRAQVSPAVDFSPGADIRVQIAPNRVRLLPIPASATTEPST